MIITIKPATSSVDLNKLIDKLESSNFKVSKQSYDNKVLLNAFGDTTTIDDNSILAFNFVESVSRISAPYKLVNKQLNPKDVIVDVKGFKIGNNMPIIVIAGPCSVESEKQLNIIAKSVKSSGAKLLRGGAFKPRTSPYAFQGLGEEGIRLLNSTSDQYDLPTVSEISSQTQIKLF